MNAKFPHWSRWIPSFSTGADECRTPPLEQMNTELLHWSWWMPSSPTGADECRAPLLELMNAELPYWSWWILSSPTGSTTIQFPPPLYSSWEANNKQQIRIRNEMQAGVVFVKKWPAPWGNCGELRGGGRGGGGGYGDGGNFNFSPNGTLNTGRVSNLGKTDKWEQKNES